MVIYPVKVDLPLSDDSLVDIFLLQWRTPMDAEEGLNPDVIERMSAYKLAVFEELATWLIANHQKEGSGPLFVIAPEISTPESCLSQIEKLIKNLSRPTVIIAGLEHTTPDRYKELIDKSSNPNKSTWLKDLEKFKMVNAAQIWIRTIGSPPQQYIQPKLRPNNEEQLMGIFPADDVLFFHHNDLRSGKGLNFCVQICSDFCNKDYVTALRETIYEKFENSDIRIDLTLLIQCNPNQAVPLFRDAANAYYDVPKNKAITESGALLYFNNSSIFRGKSSIWGDSQFLFKYGKWRLHGGEDTFHWQAPKHELWQAAVMREPGPSVYWFKYKPHYLVSPQPSADQETPFVFALNWPLPDIAPQGDGSSVRFCRIPAVAHWLLGEWSEGGVESRQQLTERFSDKSEETVASNSIIDHYTKRYQIHFDKWGEALGGGDDKSRSAVRTYFACDLGSDGYPSQKGSSKNREPIDWCSEAARGVKQWLRIYTLMSMGTDDRGLSIKVSPEWGYHALLEADTRVVFLWGGKRHTDKRMVEKYVEFMPQSQKASGSVLIVFIEQEGSPSGKPKLLENLDRIDRPKPIEGAPSHLRPAGSVVTGEQWQPFFVHADHLVDAVDSPDDREFGQVLGQTIENALSA